MSMLTIKFSGYFQCRLATDTDPPDETRGVSGYAHALPGEPGLDRILRFQKPAFIRTHSPELGVFVRRVVIDGAPIEGHKLVGASVNLLGDPKFEGRNGVIADDGYEPIYPFDFEISASNFRLRRSYADKLVFWKPEDAQPLQGLRSKGINLAPGEVAEETGVWDLEAVWADRIRLLSDELAKATKEDDKARIEGRIRRLQDKTALNFYGARMFYFVALSGTAEVDDASRVLPRPPVSDKPWKVEMWLGAWDADVFMGYVKGFVHIPLQSPPPPATSRIVTGSVVSSERPELAKLGLDANPIRTKLSRESS